MGSRNATDADFKSVSNYLRDGDFPLNEVITQIVSFDEAEEAFKTWSGNPNKTIKMLLKVY